jgi:hypothetical protein
VRLRAAQWLCAEAEKREKLEAAQPRDQRDEILSQLRGLYEKAFGPQEPLVEAVSDATAADEGPGSLCAEEPSCESSPPDEEVTRYSVAAEGGEEVRSTAAPPVASYLMERVTPPGYFPPKFRRGPTR